MALTDPIPYKVTGLLLLLYVGWCSIGLSQQNKSPSPTGSPKSGSHQDPITISNCAVFAIETAEIPAKETGVLGDVLVKLNQEVSKEQKLAKLESRTLEIEKSVAALQAQVASSEAADTTEIQVAEAIVEEAKIFLQNYERMKAKGSASETELRQKELSVSQAELKLLNAKQTHEQKKLRAKLAQASLLATDERLLRTNLVAPFEGVIKEVFKGKGEWVQAGQPVVRMSRLNEVRVDCYINIAEQNASEFVDLPVQVESNLATLQSKIFSGKITSIDPDVSSLGTVRMHATIQNQRQNDQWLLRPGMTVNLKMASVPKGNLVREPTKEGVN